MRWEMDGDGDGDGGGLPESEPGPLPLLAGVRAGGESSAIAAAATCACASAIVLKVLMLMLIRFLLKRCRCSRAVDIPGSPSGRSPTTAAAVILPQKRAPIVNNLVNFAGSYSIDPRCSLVVGASREMASFARMLYSM